MAVWADYKTTNATLWPSGPNGNPLWKAATWNAFIDAITNQYDNINGNQKNITNLLQVQIAGAADANALLGFSPALVGVGTQTGPRTTMRVNAWDTANHTRDFVLRPTTSSTAGAGYLELLTAVDGGALSNLFTATSSGLVGIGTASPTQSLDVTGAVCARSGLLTSLVNGANNNVVIPANTPVRITSGPSGVFSITGIAGGTEGRLLILANEVAQVLTINNQNAGSSVGNRFSTGTGGDVTMAASGCRALFIYINSSWYFITKNV